MSEFLSENTTTNTDSQDPSPKNGYELRIEVPGDLKSWGTDYPAYNPADYTSDTVLTEGVSKGWADPESPSEVNFSMRPSFLGQIKFDEKNGRPLNPKGRQGLAGRGNLGKWGPNNAADPIVVARIKDGSRMILLIRRKDTGEWALPGGMVDPGEHVSLTAKRELQEEAGIDLAQEHSEVVFSGYVEDPRNTDNAWMETEASLILIDFTPEPQAGDDAEGAQWFMLTDLPALISSTGGIYASHGDIIQSALVKINTTQS